MCVPAFGPTSSDIDLHLCGVLKNIRCVYCCCCCCCCLLIMLILSHLVNSWEPVHRCGFYCLCFCPQWRTSSCWGRWGDSSSTRKYAYFSAIQIFTSCGLFLICGNYIQRFSTRYFVGFCKIESGADPEGVAGVTAPPFVFSPKSTCLLTEQAVSSRSAQV